MGMCAPDIFQEKMSTLIEGQEYARAYPDYLLILSKRGGKEHLEDVENLLVQSTNTGLKVHIKNLVSAE